MTSRSPGREFAPHDGVAQQPVDELVLRDVRRERGGGFHTARRACCSMDSVARMQARAEIIARSGPHASGSPVRTAWANRSISRRVEVRRSKRWPGAAAEARGIGGPVARLRLGRLDHRRARGRRRDLNGRAGASRPFFEEQRFLLGRQDQRAFGAEEHLVVVVEGVRFDRREDGGAAARILERPVHVIGALTPVLEAVDAARRVHRFGRGVEHPVRDAHLVAAELREETPRVLLVEPPVEEVLVRRIAPRRRIVVGGRRLALATPVAVAVPGQPGVIDVAEQSALEDALIRGVIQRAVETLIADLEHAAVAERGIAHPLAARRRPTPSSSRTARACPHRDSRPPDRRAGTAAAP